MRLWSPILLPIAALYISLTNAIFADEAYQTDYHHALLGLPQAHTTFFHRPSAASKASLLYTLSERLVLGAVNPKDGAVIWRQQLGIYAANGTGPGLLKAAEGGDTLLSAVGADLRSWDATDGRLVWKWNARGEIRAIELSTSSEGIKDVFALSVGEGANAVSKLGTDSGEPTWEFLDARYARYSLCVFGRRSTDGLQWRCTILFDLLKGAPILSFFTFSFIERL